MVNARHIKYVPGHKTDKKDSAWICKLLRTGLLKGSFIPGVEQRNLRDLIRYRRKLVQQQSAETNRMIRVFEDANLKLSSVFFNVHGKTCSTVIEAILENIDHLELQINTLDKRIDELVVPIGDEIARIAEIPGMGETSAKELLAEIGVDMEVFPSEGHLASWAGVCPGNNESAGKKKLENEPWEQIGESDSYGMCMGCIQNQRNTSSNQISEIGR